MGLHAVKVPSFGTVGYRLYPTFRSSVRLFLSRIRWYGFVGKRSTVGISFSGDDEIMLMNLSEPIAKLEIFSIRTLSGEYFFVSIDSGRARSTTVELDRLKSTEIDYVDDSRDTTNG